MVARSNRGFALVGMGAAARESLSTLGARWGLAAETVCARLVPDGVRRARPDGSREYLSGETGRFVFVRRIAHSNGHIVHPEARSLVAFGWSGAARRPPFAVLVSGGRGCAPKVESAGTLHGPVRCASGAWHCPELPSETVESMVSKLVFDLVYGSSAPLPLRFDDGLVLHGPRHHFRVWPTASAELLRVDEIHAETPGV